MDKNRLKLLHFRLGEHHCAIRLESVVEIINTSKIRKIPGDSTGAVTGFIHLRERIIPIIDLRRWFSIGDNTTAGKNIIITSMTVGHVGLNVDHIDGIVQKSETEMRLPPSTGFPDPSRNAVSNQPAQDRQRLWLIELEGTFSSVEKQALTPMPKQTHTEGHRSDHAPPCD
jgi:chemotaxis signal transduction protein